ncbi:dihydrodipicolinate reductase [Corallococcus sp. bb12-1]|uniref:Dihydrodipicolinate reductase n=1 Tax=Corallococcus terminator TaxID=2316733 RepID=A0A3A8J6H8_9BACT|nr:MULTISPECIES: dihydrodipicolinate reductase [Corallococcus]MCY1042918.1 dihydrodipicolinate reductase [Corallococcus sp. bb12-1]RKG87804.1 dihydrodipicolinate reductase [Corallococcus terminator]
MAKAPDGPVPVVVMGLGFIGQEIAKAALSSQEVELIGAVDPQPTLVGRPLGDVLGQAGPRFKISESLERAVGRRKGVVVLHATSSRLAQVMDQLMEALKLGLPVASTCEELAFPYLKYPELAEKLERAAQKAGVAIVGTGVNPGFVLDRLVATAGQVCGPVRKATVSRVVDARTRREALQRKVGAGLTEEEFFDLVDREELGHVGLVESAALAALGLGLDCDDFEEEVAPVFAEEDITGGAFVVKKGRVAGMFQSVVGLEEGQERVRLELTIAVGAEDPRDRIEIDADPRLVLEIPGGVAGDRATANALVNAAPRLTAAEAGLLTVLELPAGR